MKRGGCIAVMGNVFSSLPSSSHLFQLFQLYTQFVRLETALSLHWSTIIRLWSSSQFYHYQNFCLSYTTLFVGSNSGNFREYMRKDKYIIYCDVIFVMRLLVHPGSDAAMQGRTDKNHAPNKRKTNSVRTEFYSVPFIPIDPKIVLSSRKHFLLLLCWIARALALLIAPGMWKVEA